MSIFTRQFYHPERLLLLIAFRTFQTLYAYVHIVHIQIVFDGYGFSYYLYHGSRPTSHKYTTIMWEEVVDPRRVLRREMNIVNRHAGRSTKLVCSFKNTECDYPVALFFFYPSAVPDRFIYFPKVVATGVMQNGSNTRESQRRSRISL